ncbi:MAG: T9SS type A sorting domain-containing protein [Chitinophagaceae bacterium]|nr:T9SS type A sorting domain-containing protein [Chitinophagaceae bacterium]
MKNKTLLLFCVFFFYSFITYAQAGILDSSFANNGIATYFGFEFNNSTSSAMQTDGKIIFSGLSNQDCAVTRFLSSGIPDSSFGTNGISIHKMNQINATETVAECALQPDGKIVVAGATKQWNGTDYFWDVAVLRFNSDGSIDNSFGYNGKFATDISDNLDYETKAMKIQPDGKILITGYFSSSFGPSDVFLIRLNTEGSPDSEFGLNGIVKTNVDPILNDVPEEIALQPGGKILVTGAQNYYLFSIRYLSNGSIDGAFGIDGITKTDFSDYTSDWLSARSIAITQDGKVLIGVNFSNGEDVDVMILQYTSEGILDSSFGNDGTIIYSSPDAFEFCSSIIIQPDGRIILAGVRGESYNQYPDQLLLLRYENSGLVDESFGVNGITTTSIGFSTGCNGAIINNEGKIILTGSTQLSQGSEVGCLIARYTTGLNVGIHDLNVDKLNVHVYPNPLSDHSIIEFSIQKNSETTINLVDLYGRKIKIIAAGKFSEGNHSLPISGNGLVSGIYFIELECGREVAFEKVVINK